MEEYNETSFINDIKKSKVVSKASSKVTSVKPDILWRFLKALIMGLGKAILFAPLSITLFPVINAWRSSR
jgi:hypothetical protein|tara:strand:- start:216 stop:425 length:210 start_codon:yes stop_codon:yes gene_type:complete